MPLNQVVNVKVLFATLILSFFFRPFNSYCYLKRSWDIILFLSILLLGLSYSENSRTGLGLIETSAALFALPFILCKIKDFTKESLHQIFYSFSVGLLITSIICLGNAVMSFASSRNAQVFFFDNLTSFIHSDPTYLSYYLIFAIAFGLYLLYFDQIEKVKGFVIGVIASFFFMLMLTAGNTAFVSILLVLAFFILKFLTEPEKTGYKIVVFSLAVFFLISMFYVSYFDLNSFEGRNYWERFVLWEAAIKATPNLLIGAGTGDYTSVLNDYYRSHNLSQFSLSNYNAHNQFIQTLLSNGILGLIALLIMMIRPLVLSIRYQNPLGILVFFSFFIYGLTEVFLGRYQGVVFFALMHQSFIAYYHSQGKYLL
jgi:O-antigen ligase